MTRKNSVYLLQRASERISAGAAAVALTFAMLITVDARADVAAGSPPSITVNYSEVSLATNEGAARVYRALKSAARRVCGVNSGVEPLPLRAASMQCYESALEAAVQKINRPTLTALHTEYLRNLG